MALGTAFRAFFAALFQPETAKQLRQVLDQPPGIALLPKPDLQMSSAVSDKQMVEKPKPPRTAVNRSEAITLLATLQREARLIDLVQENLSQYSDAQIGAAARPCLQQCAGTLDRLFGLQAIETAQEGQTVTVPEAVSASRYLWLGEGQSAHGKLVHHGWVAARVELPLWTGSEADTRVVAPVQVQRI